MRAMTLRYQLKDVKMNAAEESFKVGERSFNPGSFVIKTDGAPADLRNRLIPPTTCAVELVSEV